MGYDFWAGLWKVNRTLVVRKGEAHFGQRQHRLKWRPRYQRSSRITQLLSPHPKTREATAVRSWHSTTREWPLLVATRESQHKARTMRKGTPLASRVAQGVSGPSSSCVWNPRVFADDARGWQRTDFYIKFSLSPVFQIRSFQVHEH